MFVSSLSPQVNSLTGFSIDTGGGMDLKCYFEVFEVYISLYNCCQ